MSKSNRIICPYCDKKVAVDKDGKFVRHKLPWLGTTCPGSGMESFKEATEEEPPVELQANWWARHGAPEA